jgi:DNA ligase (NAD+)
MSKVRIKELETKISKAQTSYYNGIAIIDDDEYDALIYELANLDPNNKLVVKVGAEPSNEWVKEKHLTSLGSLDKVNTPQDMSDWISDKLGNRQVMVVEKLDGLSLGIQYENGKLTKSLLRGNGLEGENILQNVIKMNGAIKNLSSSFNGTIRGEIVLLKSDHEEYFPDYSNPRNAASGLCRKLDGDDSEHLTLMCYDIIGDINFKTEEDKFNFLIKNKFITPNYKMCKTSQEVNDIWKEYQDKTRASLDYEIDGLVVYCNDIYFQESLGQTNMRPKGKLAFKFANQFIKTTVLEITWTTGNSGRVTPICWIDEVNLLGSNIKKASVYNIDYIEKLGLGKGAEVLVCKAGEIIPRIEKVIKSGEQTIIPINCPTCNSLLEMNGKHLSCTNISGCVAQLEGRIKNWIKELNILEFGETLITKLVETGKVTTIADLYTLTIDSIASIDRMGKKSATKVYNNLWAANEVSLEVLLGGLSIPMIGQSSIKTIMEAGCDTLEKFGQLKANDFEKVSGIGPVKAKSLADGLINNQQLIIDLLTNGVKIKEKKQKIVGKLSNLSFCFTGTMLNKRAVLEKMVEDNGGDIKDKVIAGLTYLVIADPSSTSSKAVSARKFGTNLISEDNFLDMVNQ